MCAYFLKRVYSFANFTFSFRRAERSLFAQGHVKTISFPVRDIPLPFDLFQPNFGRIYPIGRTYSIFVFKRDGFMIYHNVKIRPPKNFIRQVTNETIFTFGLFRGQRLNFCVLSSVKLKIRVILQSSMEHYSVERTAVTFLPKLFFRPLSETDSTFHIAHGASKMLTLNFVKRICRINFPFA